MCDIYKFTHLQSYLRLVFSVSASLNTVIFFYQVTLESCQLMTTANLELVEPHLDRMQKLIKAWKTEVSLSCVSFTTKEGFLLRNNGYFKNELVNFLFYF